MISETTKATWRELFPVTKNITYLNHAAVGPLSTRAFDAMRRHAVDQREFGATHWKDWYAEYELLRAAAGRLIGAAPDEIAILKNTSEGISFVAEGLEWERGDNVVTTDLEFPSNYTPWKNLERRGVECRVVESRNGAYEPSDVERLLDSRTRVVAVSSVAFHNGFAPDLEAIGEICDRRGILFCVDAIQSVGAIPIDVRRARISFLAADGHKWLCAPEGAAIFYVAHEHRQKLRVIEYGWTNIERRGKFLDASTNLLPDARRFEAGSLNTNGIYGLRAALDLVLEIGIETIAAEVIRIAGVLAEELEGAGLAIGSPRPIRSGIVGAIPRRTETLTLLKVHRHLEELGIICSPREGMLRFSAHFYNDDADVKRVTQAFARLE